MKRDFRFDKMDYEILRIMHENARMPLSVIAKDLDLDVRTVKKRLDAMLIAGVIRTTVVTNPSKFGYPCIVELKLEVRAEKLSEYLEKFKVDTRIPFVGVYWDKNMLDMQGRFSTNEEIYEFVNEEVASLDGVKICSATIVPKILKNVDLWFPSEVDFEG